MTAAPPTGIVLAGPPRNNRHWLRLQPGISWFEPGVYRPGSRCTTYTGAAGAITIAGPADGLRLVVAADGHHTVSLMDRANRSPAIELDGRHQPVDGVKAEGQGHRRCVGA
jgi:hypothetical protein